MEMQSLAVNSGSSINNHGQGSTDGVPLAASSPHGSEGSKQLLSHEYALLKEGDLDPKNEESCSIWYPRVVWGVMAIAHIASIGIQFSRLKALAKAEESGGWHRDTSERGDLFAWGMANFAGNVAVATPIACDKRMRRVPLVILGLEVVFSVVALIIS